MKFRHFSFVIMIAVLILPSWVMSLAAQTPTPTIPPTGTPSATPASSVTPGVTGTPVVSLTPSDDDEDFASIDIVIIGPVTSINVNIITIYNFEIVLDSHEDDDDVLADLKIGDIVRVEGTLDQNSPVIVIVAINITIINIEIHTSGNTGNAGQPGGGGNTNNSGGGQPSGGSGDDDDDDDDDD